MIAVWEAVRARPCRALMVFVVVIGTALRLPGDFGQGYPECFYPDEASSAQRALYFGARHTANPGWFNKPALAYYLFFAAFGAVYGGGRVAGQFPNPDAFGLWASDHMGMMVVAARLVVTLFGVATLWLTYLAGKRLGGRALGVVAAAVLAVAQGHIEASQVAKEDVICAFFSTGAIILLLTAHERGRRRDWVGAGVLAGLGMATKYYSIGLAAPALAAAILRRPGPPATVRAAGPTAGVVIWALSFVGGFFVGSPYNFLDGAFAREQLLPGVRRLATTVGLTRGEIFPPQLAGTSIPRGTTVVDRFASVAEAFLSPDGLGPALVVLMIIGLLLVLWRRRASDAVALVATVAQLCFIGLAIPIFPAPRHVLVVYPFAAVLVAEPLVALAGSVRRAGVGGRATIGCCLLALATLVPLGDASVAETIAISARCAAARRTEVVARDFIEATIPAGATILNDDEVLPLRTTVARCDWVLDRLSSVGVLGQSGYQASIPMLWQLRRKAAAATSHPTYDIIVLEAPWQSEVADPNALAGYNGLWPRYPESHPADLSAVERYTGARHPARNATAPTPTATPVAPLWMLGGRPVEWLVTGEENYAKYRADGSETKRRKRAAFPAHAAFYDDLAAHYACLQWSQGRTLAGPTVRLYDLRRRIDVGAPTVTEMPQPNGPAIPSGRLWRR